MPTRRFRPNLERFDDRIVPTAATVLAPAVVPGINWLGVSKTDAAVTPDTLNTYYNPATWLADHDSYANEAATDKAPIVFLGDSITYFWNNAASPTQGEAAWNSTFAPLKAENFGLLGDQTGNLLWRVENGELAGKPKVAVVMIGINNLLHGETAEETAAGVSAVVHEIHVKSPRTHVLVLGILPVHTYYTEAPLAKVEQANAEIEKVTRGPRTSYLNVGAEFLGTGDQINTSLYMSDGIHPSAAGYQLLAESLDGPIQDLISPGKSSGN